MNNFFQETDPRSTPDSLSERHFPFELSDVTTGSEPSESLSFAGEPDPLRQAREIIPQIENEFVAKQTEKLLSIIQKLIQLVQKEKPDISYIPPIHGCIDDDGSMLLEWIFPDFRIGFNIESKPENSSWYLVSNKNVGDVAASGPLTNIREKIALLLSFIVLNI